MSRRHSLVLLVAWFTLNVLYYELIGTLPSNRLDTPQRFVPIHGEASRGQPGSVYWVDQKAFQDFIIRIGGDRFAASDVHICENCELPWWLELVNVTAFAAPCVGINLRRSDAGEVTQWDQRVLCHESYHWAQMSQPFPQRVVSLLWRHIFSVILFPLLFFFCLMPKIVSRMRETTGWRRLLWEVELATLGLVLMVALPYYIDPEEVMASEVGFRYWLEGGAPLLTLGLASVPPALDSAGNLFWSASPPQSSLSMNYPIVFSVERGYENVMFWLLVWGCIHIFCQALRSRKLPAARTLAIVLVGMVIFHNVPYLNWGMTFALDAALKTTYLERPLSQPRLKEEPKSVSTTPQLPNIQVEVRGYKAAGNQICLVAQFINHTKKDRTLEFFVVTEGSVFERFGLPSARMLDRKVSMRFQGGTKRPGVRARISLPSKVPVLCPFTVQIDPKLHQAVWIVWKEKNKVEFQHLDYFIQL